MKRFAWLVVLLVAVSSCREQGAPPAGVSPGGTGSPAASGPAPASTGGTDSSSPGAAITGEAVDRGRPVVTAGDESIIVEECLFLFPRLQTHGAADRLPGARALESIIGDLLFYLDARQKGVDLNIAEKARVKAVRDGWLGFHYMGKTVKTFAPTEKEVSARTPASFEVARVSEITVPTREAAREVLGLLAKGGKFEELARTRSISPSASAGGKVAYEFPRGTTKIWGREIQERFYTVAAGSVIPEPVETEMGFTVFRVDERRQMGKEDVRRFLVSTAADIANERQQAFHEKVLKRYPLQVFEEKLKAASDDPVGNLDVIVAKVGGNPISYGEALSLIDQGKTVPARGKAAHEAAGRALRDGHLLYAMREEAVARGMLKDPVVKANYARYQREIVSRKYREKILARIAVSEEEVRKSYDAYLREAKGKTVYRLELGEFPDREVAVQAARRLEKGESLAGVIPPMFHGQQGMDRMPEVAYLESELPAAIKERVRDMARGKVYGPIAAGEGTYYVVKFLAKETARPRPFQESRKDLERRVRGEKYPLEYSAIVIRKSRETKLTIDRELFDTAYRLWSEGKLK